MPVLVIGHLEMPSDDRLSAVGLSSQPIIPTVHVCYLEEDDLSGPERIKGLESSRSNHRTNETPEHDFRREEVPVQAMMSQMSLKAFSAC